MNDKEESKYLIITIEEPPRYEIRGEAFLEKKIVKRSQIYHNWLKNDSADIIGIKISSWMISTLRLATREKELINKWGKSGSDLEVYFGSNKKGNKNSVSEDMISFTTTLGLDGQRHGISFPLSGNAMDKKEMGKLEANLMKWKAE